MNLLLTSEIPVEFQWTGILVDLKILKFTGDRQRDLCKKIIKIPYNMPKSMKVKIVLAYMTSNCP